MLWLIFNFLVISFFSERKLSIAQFFRIEWKPEFVYVKRHSFLRLSKSIFIVVCNETFSKKIKYFNLNRLIVKFSCQNRSRQQGTVIWITQPPPQEGALSASTEVIV